MKPFSFAVFIGLVCAQILLVNAYAQKSTEEATLVNEQAQNEEADNASGNDQSAAEKDDSPKKKPTKKTFKPTEEISEDRPVPFPVDI